MRESQSDGMLTARQVADFHQMQQVFVNIITNAEQAMSEAHGQGKLTVKTQKAGNNITITLADTGPGILKEDLDRIFDPFFTTKEVGKGTGLGLSISFGIVHEHGGRLYAKSKAGKGTTFIVEIPIIEDSPPEEEAPADAAWGDFAPVTARISRPVRQRPYYFPTGIHRKYPLCTCW